MNLKIITTLLVVAAFAVLFTAEEMFSPPVEELPILGQVRAFELTDSSDELFRSDSLQGRLWVANFFFTSCKGVCPTIMGSIERVQKHFSENENIHAVSISVDPERDSTKVLRRYKTKFPVANSRWHFLTGDEYTVSEVSEKAFQLAAGSIPDAHSQRIVLVDGTGAIRGYYDGLESGVARKVIADIDNLIAAEEVK